MIEQEQFAQAMGLLSDRFNRPLHPGTQRIYYEILNSELSGEELEVAVRLAIRRLQFWPSPQQLIDYVQPPRNLELEAMNAWVQLFGKTSRREEIERLGESAMSAFRAIGGNDAMREMSVDQVSFIRRDFITAYKLHAQKGEDELMLESARPRVRGILKSVPTILGNVIPKVLEESRA